MAMKTKIGYGNRTDIDTAISATTLDEGDLVITKDTEELAFIKPDKSKMFIKSRSSKEYTLNGTDLGALKNGDSIPEGTSIDELLNLITQKAIAPTYTKPTVSLAKSGAGTAAGSYEAGTSVTPVLTATFNKNDAGDLTKLSILKGGSDVGSDTSSPYTYTGEAIVLGDETVTFTAKAEYSDGPVKNNNLDQPDATGQIKAGAKESSALSFVGQRNAFWGYGAGTIESPSSDQIRGLANKRLNVSANNVISVAIATGSQHIIFALPTPRTLKQVSYDDLGDKGMLSAFAKTTVQVADARGGSNGMKDYNVYVYNMSTPSAATMNFSFTIG